ncbi:MAG: histidine triad nucleotide-binding protein [Deltaproteobacteria bacterium]|nr:histidine triad nucleotide-binding protein [Deltaproteobacteria bacterium]MBW2595508.1 histidine triad nucleotide-binding protein [Deltaproteobacteria bacterium]MBW2649679.1 histidine triad nucleotide-binding protein [Deltaproteobacteria bacterium]
MENCIFCKIVRGEIPANIVYESESVLAFDDVNPMAPVHVVVVPKAHVATLMDVSDKDMMNDMISAVQEVAKIKGIDKRGFRTVINCNEDGGQVVFHLHVHIMGGRKLSDDMG